MHFFLHQYEKKCGKWLSKKNAFLQCTTHDHSHEQNASHDKSLLKKKRHFHSLPFVRIRLNPGCPDICPIKCLIKGSKWERLGLIAYATPVMVNLLGPQGSDAPCLCNALITTRHQQHWACSLPLTHPIPQEYISIFYFKRAVICNCTTVG